MNREQFWNCIGLIDIEALREQDEESALEPLIDHLAELGSEEMKSFDDHLSEVLFALDTRIHHQNTYQSESFGAGDDSFLYARAFVVAQGRDYYELVVKAPSMMPASYEEAAESLLYATMAAWEQSGNDADDWDYVSPVSYETGSNRSGWAPD